MRVLAWVLLLGGVAAASAAEPTRPLAVPYGAPRPPPAPKVDPDRQAAFDAQALRAVPVQSLVATTVLATTTAWDPWGPGWVDMAYSTPAIARIESWAILRGGRPIDNPTYLATIGRVDERERLVHKLRRNRTAGSVLLGVGIAGIGTTLAGVVGMDAATTWPEYHRWRQASVGGIVAMSAGFLGASVPRTRERRLQLDPAAIRTPEQAEREITSYNGALRDQLGLPR